MGQAFTLLIQEEKQRAFGPSSRMPIELASLSVSSFNNNGKGPMGKLFRTNFQKNNYAGGTSNLGTSKTTIMQVAPAIWGTTTIIMQESITIQETIATGVP